MNSRIHYIFFHHVDTYLVPFLTVWHSCMVLVLYYFFVVFQQIIFEIENLFLGIDITSSGRQP